MSSGQRWSRWRVRRLASLRADWSVARLLQSAGRPLLAGFVGSHVAVTALGIASVLALGLLVGAAVEALREGRPELLIWPLVGFALVLVLTEVVGVVQSVLGYAVSRRVEAAGRVRLRRAAARPDVMSHLEDPQVLDKTATAVTGVLGVTMGGAAVATIDIVFLHIMLVSQALIVAQYSVLLAAALLAVVLLARMKFKSSGLTATDVWVGQIPELRRSEYLGGLADGAATAKENRIFGLGGFFLGLRRETWTGAMHPIWAARQLMLRDYWHVCLALAAVYALTNLLLARSASAGAISIAELTIYVTAASQMLAGSSARDSAALQYGRPQLEALVAVEAAAQALTVDRPRVPLAGAAPQVAICFQGLSFRYPGRDEAVFDGLDLTVHAGQSLAIVGVNGVGKTTLIKLLSGLYRPAAGRVTVDGQDLADVDIESWRRRLAVIFQDFVCYPLTAAENVGWGAPSSADGIDSLRRAARRAGALEIVEALPAGWQTTLSRSYTEGADLSGGQWQRVALARALYAVGAGASVLVLDEPTANLDVRAEAELFDRFLELTAGLTTILVSHRFSSVRRADRIVVLEEGRVRQDGSHQELMAEDGPYRTLFLLQAQRFAQGASHGGSPGAVHAGTGGRADA